MRAFEGLFSHLGYGLLGHSHLAHGAGSFDLFSQFDLAAGDLLPQRFFAGGSDVGAQGHFGVNQRLAGVGQSFGQVVSLEFEPAEVYLFLVEFDPIALELGQIGVALGTTPDIAVGQPQTALVGPLLVQLFDAVEGGDALAHVGGQGFKVAHRLELVSQRFHVH